MGPEPIPKYVLLKEIFQLPSQDRELRKCYVEVKQTRWYRQIADNQLPDGSWGPFHSSSIRKDGRSFVTQTYVGRIVALGLNKKDACVAKAIKYMEFLLRNKNLYPDRPVCLRGHEQDWYSFVVPMAVTPFLVQLDPDNRLAGKYARMLADLVEVYYTTNDAVRREENFYELKKKLYSIRRYVRRGKEKPNLGTYRYCYPLSSRYVTLPVEVLRKHLTYMLQTQGALYYCYGRWKMEEPVQVTDWRFPQWLRGLHQLSSIPEWHRFSAPLYNAIWGQRDENGLWTMSNSKKNKGHQISSSWRRKQNVTIDHSTAILRILNRY
jgi:hypothetical protein